jgi:hypothetical protein
MADLLRCGVRLPQQRIGMTPQGRTPAEQVVPNERSNVERWQDFPLKAVANFVAVAISAHDKRIAPRSSASDIDNG